jgi:ASC-1-like (ASCH) protein
MKYILKIDKKFWDMIAQGTKTKEYRKMNKRHIKVGDTITFCDLDCKEVFGDRIVKDVNILHYEDFTKFERVDTKSMDFICKNYNTEDYLLEFELESIKTIR